MHTVHYPDGTFEMILSDALSFSVGTPSDLFEEITYI